MSPADTRRNSEKLGLEEPWWVEKSAPGEQAPFGKQLNRVGGGPRSWMIPLSISMIRDALQRD